MTEGVERQEDAIKQTGFRKVSRELDRHGSLKWTEFPNLVLVFQQFPKCLFPS